MKETGEEGKLKRVTFNRTPIMSTYLLAFVVGDFDYVEARDSNGILVRVYTPVGKKEQGQFALDVSVCVCVCVCVHACACWYMCIFNLVIFRFP